MLTWQADHQVSGFGRYIRGSLEFQFGRGKDQVKFELEVE